MIARRKFLIGAATLLLAAPAIVRASSLMSIRQTAAIVPHWTPNWGRHMVGGSETMWIWDGSVWVAVSGFTPSYGAPIG